MRSISLFFLLSLFSNSMAGTIQIAVAANVSYAIEDLKAAFSKDHPSTRVRVILGSSGKLTAQIKHGAPYGLFMSANMKYPEALFEEKLAAEKPVVYAEGSLALFSVKRNDFSKGLTLLKEKEVNKIAVSNPKTAPYGIAALEALKNAKLYDAIKPKLIFGESVSQTVSYAVTAADIGLIAKSSLYSRTMLQYKENEHWKEVDPKLYTPIKQGMVILNKGASSPEVKAFYDFMLSEEAQKILRNFGYHTP